MIVGIHQPQYLPWLGYFDKIDKVDTFVLLDDTQYKKQEWQNRNKIKTPNGELWLTVPVLIGQGHKQKINQIKIDNKQKWSQKHLGRIKNFYSSTPYFKDYIDFFKDTYSKRWETLADLNIYFVRKIAEFLGINTTIILASSLNYTGKATDLNVSISQILEADTYLSGMGAKDYLVESKFKDINLEYQNFNHPVYPQLYGNFISHLSVIDLLFNCGKESLKIIRGEKT